MSDEYELGFLKRLDRNDELVISALNSFNFTDDLFVSAYILNESEFILFLKNGLISNRANPLLIYLPYTSIKKVVRESAYYYDKKLQRNIDCESLMYYLKINLSKKLLFADDKTFTYEKLFEFLKEDGGLILFEKILIKDSLLLDLDKKLKNENLEVFDLNRETVNYTNFEFYLKVLVVPFEIFYYMNLDSFKDLMKKPSLSVIFKSFKIQLLFLFFFLFFYIISSLFEVFILSLFILFSLYFSLVILMLVVGKDGGR